MHREEMHMEKIALIVLLDRFADWEIGFLAPLFHSPDMAEPKWRTMMVSLKKEPIESMGKLTVLPDSAIDDVPAQFDALILIGGQSWRTPQALDVIPLIDKARKLDVPLAGICDAANFLGWHGFLNEVKHTGNAGGEMATYQGTKYTNKQDFDAAARAISDKNTVTADGASSRHFAEHVARLLALYPDAQIDEWAVVHDIGEKAYFESK
jgi:putative intracellular protease/amidase